ncbi:sn-glycerol-3-phosphate ABC transporter ATP-binding protein UgpC [Thalassococcus sp. CAU 1522]|uniref:Sn-glycerol-3-phosphate ABC transporter ATP-binding protein UgpC n=1 Tax=Thalassococcus arenae TaxID=2851652 RepID=A0ABS6ND75_9RHOB|nr:sn-glycerol-3-phosphate ABC transporter ATP-binding protein UgpC [Thalassococcus arenae]MBV2361530.1 sn-glycerol-3-phosphate ABC transporter ATP-binding protein UgpC [Thalassococcus arenae]
MAEVILKNLTKRWGDFIGVDNQSLHILDREFLVLLGPSGCGKTTTMRMIAGLEDPTGGEIWIGDRKVNDDLPKDRDVAMVFQNYGLYPHMTIFENIAYPLRVRGVAKSEIAPRVQKAAEQVELTQFLDRKPKALSGGQRQRVALARAIVRTPKVFLMDEPLSNLDAKLRVTMRAELKHLSRELQITTVYVTHDQIEAMTLADRVAVMKHGVIQQLGTPDEIYNDPANLFVAGFIGSPAMNLINGSIRDGMFVTTGGTRLVPVPTEDRASVILGVRADDMTVHEAGQGDIDVKIYAFENTGESTLLTVQWGKQRVIARGDRHLRKEQDDIVGISLNTDHLYLFDPETENRIRV